MIISPVEVIANGWIQNFVPQGIQPNSIDVRLNKLFTIEGNLLLGVNDRQLPTWKEVEPDKTGFFTLQANICYQFECFEFVRIPENVTMRIHMRSTLNRSGVFIGAGHWDSGFENYIGAAFYPFCSARIEQGARVAQAVFTRADSAFLYNGAYQGREN